MLKFEMIWSAILRPSEERRGAKGLICELSTAWDCCISSHPYVGLLLEHFSLIDQRVEITTVLQFGLSHVVVGDCIQPCSTIILLELVAWHWDTFLIPSLLLVILRVHYTQSQSRYST